MNQTTLQKLQQDCLTVLGEITIPWKVPADTIFEAIALQGWNLRHAPLPWGQLCACDAWRQEILISHDFEQNLTCPSLHREVLHWLLAAQLGHIRMHTLAILQGKGGSALESAATQYAMAYLLPLETLQTHPDVRYLSHGEPTKNERWRRLSRLAEHFLVPTACVQATLERYGLIAREKVEEAA